MIIILFVLYHDWLTFNAGLLCINLLCNRPLCKRYVLKQTQGSQYHLGPFVMVQQYTDHINSKVGLNGIMFCKYAIGIMVKLLLASASLWWFYIDIRVNSRDLQPSNIPIWRYHCLGEVVFLKIWNQYWLPSDTVHQRFLFISPAHLQT